MHVSLPFLLMDDFSFIIFFPEAKEIYNRRVVELEKGEKKKNLQSISSQKIPHHLSCSLPAYLSCGGIKITN